MTEYYGNYRLGWVTPSLALLLGLFSTCGCSRSESRYIAQGVAARPAMAPDKSKATVAPVRLIYDFGYVAENATLAHTFSLEGDKRPITEVITSCKCTAVNVVPGQCEEGVPTRVEVGYRPPNQRVDDETVIRVHVDGLLEPAYHLVLKAQVRPSVSFSRDSIEFGRVSSGQTLSRFIYLENFSHFDWENVRIDSSPGWVDAALHYQSQTGTANNGPRQRWQITAQVQRGVASERQHGQLVLEIATRAGTQYATLPVNAWFADPISLDPPVIYFGRVLCRSGPLTKRIVIDTSRADPQLIDSTPLVQHNLGQQLRLDLATLDGSTYELAATLNPVIAGTLCGVAQLTYSGNCRAIPIVADVYDE